MYFDIFTTVEDVKKRYRMLSKLFHPDKGGPAELMVELTDYYQKRLKEIEYIPPEFDEDEDYDVAEYNTRMQSILDFAEITLSFNPSWIKSVWDKYKDAYEIPESVRKSIDNIYKKFHVEEKLKEYSQKKKEKKKEKKSAK